MIAEDYSIVLWLLECAFVFWASRRGPSDDWWYYIPAFVVLNWIGLITVRLYRKWQMRRFVQRILALEPEEQQLRMQHMWLGLLRQYVAESVAAEGSSERHGMVERFPFGRRHRAENAVLYWITLLVGLSCIAALFVFSRLNAATAWLVWVVAACSAIGTAWFRKRGQHLATVLEVTPFGIAELDSGRRRVIAFAHPLLFRNRPLLRRAELVAVKSGEVLHLDYRRLGFVRLVHLVAQHAFGRNEDAT